MNTGPDSSPQRDPFSVLRRPDAPIAPDPAFAARLRRDLQAALAQLTSPSLQPSIQEVRSMTVTPYLSVRNAAAAIDFYVAAFGAVEAHRLLGDDGRVGHAEITIGGSTVMLADEYPEIDSVGPETRGGPTCTFTITVTDADHAYQRALDAGAIGLREPADQFHGNRSAIVADLFGQRWTLSAPIEQLTTEQYAARAAEDHGHGSFHLETPDPESGSGAPGAESFAHQVKALAPGDLYYFTLPVADLPKAQTFFGAVLGWRFAAPDQGHVENISAPPGGVNDRGDDTGARLWFVVDDIHTAIDRVLAAGGTADEPILYDSGWSADCTDDQGTIFSLSVPAAKYTA
ncbi:MAG TPA: VOC family protein [Ilumatobacteraceae bacterium]|nr:VOC family protein [Ilumatobacteraceae bacterium]